MFLYNSITYRIPTEYYCSIYNIIPTEYQYNIYYKYIIQTYIHILLYYVMNCMWALAHLLAQKSFRRPKKSLRRSLRRFARRSLWQAAAYWQQLWYISFIYLYFLYIYILVRLLLYIYIYNVVSWLENNNSEKS